MEACSPLGSPVPGILHARTLEWNSDEIRKRFAAKVGHRLFEVFDGTKEEVPAIEGEIPGTATATESVTESITNAAQETKTQSAVDEFAEAAANVTKTEKPAKKTATKAVAEDDFFDNLEKEA